MLHMHRLFVVAVAVLLLPLVVVAQGGTRVFLPLVRNDPLPTATPIPPADGQLINGNFEQGPVGWFEVSDHDAPLVTNDFPAGIGPANGKWAAWLGGFDNETSGLVQQIRVPSRSPRLTYWRRIVSSELCGGFDVGGVGVLRTPDDDPTVLEAVDLCSQTATSRYERRVIDLSAFAGETVYLIFVVGTDRSRPSSMLIDDVSLTSSGATAAASSDERAAQTLREYMGKLRIP